jgi:hypothetical protein
VVDRNVKLSDTMLVAEFVKLLISVDARICRSWADQWTGMTWMMARRQEVWLEYRVIMGWGGWKTGGSEVGARSAMSRRKTYLRL